MRILIIGGTGIISTGITRLLLERGDEVVLYNRGQRPSQVEGNYTTITGDRKDFAAFEKQMADAGTFDCVIDMVCYLPEEAESAIRAFKGHTGQYIFCSTVDVYTKPAAAYPITEAAERLPSKKFMYGYNKANIFYRWIGKSRKARYPLPSRPGTSRDECRPGAFGSSRGG